MVILKIIRIFTAGINKTFIMEKLVREEALRRLRATKIAKEHRIEVLKERMCEKFRDKMGTEPKNVIFL